MDCRLAVRERLVVTRCQSAAADDTQAAHTTKAIPVILTEPRTTSAVLPRIHSRSTYPRGGVTIN